MDPRIELAVLTARVAYHVAVERITDPRPTTLREVPPGPEQLTDEWLTLALCDGTPGARVIGHRLGARDAGTSSRQRLTVAYNEAGDEAGLPRALFTKSAPNFKTRLQSASASLGKIEANFYAQVRPQLQIEAPPTRYSAFDPVTTRQLLIVDDLEATVGAEFGTVLTRTLTLEQAEKVVDTLAAVHARFWGAPLQRLYGSWLWTSYEFQAKLNVTLGAEQRILAGFERGREVIQPRLYGRRHEVFAALMRALELNVSGPQTMLHSDVHPGNWYITPAGAMGICDWQCVAQGGWASDISYALASHLTPEQRGEWEAELVARHGERLAEAGIEPPADAFLEYRQQFPHAMFMWLATLGRHPLHQELQGQEITLELVRRILTAADELQMLDAIADPPRVVSVG